MAKEMDSAAILRHLEEDMGELLELFTRENVFEVMLNPYRREDGMYEGHIWYEEAGVGMQRLTKQTRIDLSHWSKPKVGDTVLYRYVDCGDYILNYHTITNLSDTQLLTAMGIVLKNTLLTDSRGITYLEQEENYRLCTLADNIALNNYSSQNPVDNPGFEKINLEVLVEKINQELGRLVGVLFKIGIVKIDKANLEQFNLNIS
ncbi:MAG: hypothetical protein QG673_1876 [Pseudomonadota bacterium]|nr:hypothetical protein [Pseudomonadota bacterium]